MPIPKIISVDDHLVEPPDLWADRLPKKYLDRGPRVVREKGVQTIENAQQKWIPDADAPGAVWADVWYYDDLAWPLMRGYAMSGNESDDALQLITYDDCHPGTYGRAERIAMMEANHTDVSLCYPSFARFCGQTFLEREDKVLAKLCVETYNDYMIDEWCGDERPARLVPMTIVPLWDAELAAAEVRRCADKGSHAITFSECPPYLELPSIYSGYWDPMFQACVETETIVNLHVGSASRLVTTAADAPADMTLCLTYVNSLLALSDYLYSGIFELFPELKIVLAESQAGWIPFAAERVDNTWKKGNEKFTVSTQRAGRRARELPSSQVEGHIFGAIFDDYVGLENRDQVGMEQIVFETDIPHADSTYPQSLKVLEEMTAMAGMNDDEIYKLVRGNAIKLYGLDRHFGITE